MRLGMRPAILNGVEAFTELNSDLDQEVYSRFLETSRWIARVVLGSDDRNLYIAERLVAAGVPEDEVLDMIPGTLNRQASAVTIDTKL